MGLSKWRLGVWNSQGGEKDKRFFFFCITSVQFSRSVMSDSLRPHESPGLPVHHQLPEFTQTHAHGVGDAIQPSHLLSSPSPPAPNPSQHQGLFQWVSSSHKVVKVLEFQLSLVSINYTTQFKLCTRDYATTMYPAGGEFLLPENLLNNPDILECILWDWVWRIFLLSNSNLVILKCKLLE